MKNTNWIKKIITFYSDGFKSMTVGKTLWVLVMVKLFIMFAILKAFFFPNILNTKFKSAQDKGNYVGTELVTKKLEKEENKNK